jgi:glycosyltransferase involved in cell wall biosynthesis
MARGEWVSFIDSDDWVPPYYLQVFHDNKEKADVNFFLADVMKADGTGVRYIMPEVGCTEIDETSSRLLFSLVYNESGADVLGWTWDKFYRLTIINQFKVRFDESISYYEDELFALVVLNHASTFRVMSSSLYRYRALPTGLTASNSVDFARLCDAFCGIGDKMKFGPLKRVAFCQALRWAVMAIRGPRGFRAIGKMANVLRNYSDWLCICGRYGKIKDVINRIPRPVAIGLLSIAKIVGLLRTNVCVRIANQ